MLAQDEASSAVWGMPGAVAQAGLAHRDCCAGRRWPERFWADVVGDGMRR